jgi:hypothetical protein
MDGSCEYTKQPRTADKGWSSSLGVLRRDNTFSPQKQSTLYEMLYITSQLDIAFGSTLDMEILHDIWKLGKGP